MEMWVIGKDRERKHFEGATQIKIALEPPPYLHISLERLGRIALFDSITEKFFIMDKEAFSGFGNALLARNRVLPFIELQPGFRYLIPTITSQCNMACSYCLGSKGVKGGKPSRWNVIKEAIDYVSRDGEEKDMLLFMPGEVMLEEALLERTIEYAKKKLNLSKIRVSTNGTMAGADYRRISKAAQLQISFDGPPEIQDMQRPLQGGGSSSRLVEGTVRRLISEGLNFDVHAVITALHAGKEEYTARYFHGLGVPLVSLASPQPTGSGADYKGHDYSGIIASKLKISELFDLLGIRGGTQVKSYFGSDRAKFCALGHVFYLGADGLVSACPCLADQHDVEANPGSEKLVLGSFDTQRGEFQLKDLVELKEAYKKAECSDCDHHLCWGGCPLRNLSGESLTKPDRERCKNTTTEIKAYLRYLAERDVIGLKPWLEEREGRLLCSCQFSEFQLSKESMQSNPFLRFSPAEDDLDKLASMIADFSGANPKRLVLFLLSPCGRARLDARETVALKEFLYALKKSRVFFRITKPIGIEDYNEDARDRLFKEFSMPRSCHDCMEMFTVVDGRARFCDGTVGPEIGRIFDREELFRMFCNSKIRRCPNSS